MRYTIEEIKRANQDAGLYWFSPYTLRFFSSRISAETFGPDAEGRTLFVSSEQSDYSAPRLYSVRAFSPDGATIDTIGEFQGHDSLRAAQRAARAYVAGVADGA